MAGTLGLCGGDDQSDEGRMRGAGAGGDGGWGERGVGGSGDGRLRLIESYFSSFADGQSTSVTDEFGCID